MQLVTKHCNPGFSFIHGEEKTHTEEIISVIMLKLLHEPLRLRDWLSSLLLGACDVYLLWGLQKLNISIDSNGITRFFPVLDNK